MSFEGFIAEVMAYAFILVVFGVFWVILNNRN